MRQVAIGSPDLNLAVDMPGGPPLFKEPKFEVIRTDTDSTVRYLSFGCADLATDHDWHYHPQYELTWIIRSSGVRCVGSTLQRYAADDLVLVGPNLPHYWHNENAAGAEPAELIVVQFDASFLGGDFLRLPEATGIRRLFRQAARGIQFRGHTSSGVGPALRALSFRRGISRLTGLIEVLNSLAECEDLLFLAPALLPLGDSMSPTDVDRLNSVCRHVHAQLSGPICQAEIARHVGLGTSAFSRFFHVATGQTFVSYVNTLRINKSCQLLTETNLSVTAIALTCGYDSISNFNRRFQAQKSMTPTQYRAGIQRAVTAR